MGANKAGLTRQACGAQALSVLLPCKTEMYCQSPGGLAGVTHCSEAQLAQTMVAKWA